MEFDFKWINHISPAQSVGDVQIRKLFWWASATEGNAVEIGSYMGRSTSAIGLGLKIREKGDKLYAVDPHKSRACNYDAFLKNIKNAGCQDVVVPVRDFAENVFNSKKPKELFEKTIGFLFIDGDHTYEGLKKDLAWIDLVHRGGVIIFHDYIPSKYPGIVKAITEFQEKNNKMYQHELLGSLIIFKKK